MASRLLTRRQYGRVLVGGAIFGGVAITTRDTVLRTKVNAEAVVVDPAEEQFKTASAFAFPAGWTGHRFTLKTDYPILPRREVAADAATGYPTMPGPDMPLPGFDLKREAPWLAIDYVHQPLDYCRIVKEYCWDGNVIHNFDITKNTVRQWYHPPWMHDGATGREPIHGLTFERVMPPQEFAETQTGFVQNWACGFYNSIGATVFGKVWENPAEPKWEDNIQFPEGTCVFKILLTEADDEQIPILTGAPTLPAVICETQTKPWPPNARKTEASDVRLIQVDFAVRDNRAPIGWVFGTFMYHKDSPEKNPWDKIIPVGLQWGNDPKLTPESVRQGVPPYESWVNPEADKVRVSLKGKRPSWGWNGRMNGPADNYISACASCHSTAQRDKGSGMNWQPTDSDAKKMTWFQNLTPGEPFDKGNKSADYSLQLMMGYQRFMAWKHPVASNLVTYGLKKFVYREPQHEDPEKDGALRQ